jgi:hypothetical protein
MFERLVETSEAMRDVEKRLIPALSGCRDCKTLQAIASPVLGTCPDCGTELAVISAELAQRMSVTGPTRATAWS